MLSRGMAEGMGFEPTVRSYSYNGLANPRQLEDLAPQKAQNPSVSAPYRVGENQELRGYRAVSPRRIPRRSLPALGLEGAS